jgi:NitT/TauT family transport system substrate-binding protein
MILRALAAAALILAGWAARAEEPPKLRIALLAFGTVNWLTDVIATHGLDRAEGFRLETVELAGRDASTIAFKAADVDMIVADWVWAMHERAGGADVRFLPYSRALGALMVMPEAGIDDLCDLDGRTVGVVGGALDKSWLIYQALARRDCGWALDARVNTLFGAPPLMSRQLTTGDADAVSTYWHYAARLQAAGATPLIDVTGALDRLGVRPAPPLVGFVYDAARTDPALMARMERAVAAAGRLMAADDAEWDRLRPLMRAEGEAEFKALRDAYRAGIVADGWTAGDTAAAERLHAALIEAGGPAFAEDAGAFDAAAFPR